MALGVGVQTVADHHATRDDPNIDEATRLRNRIAELESLVRELRGKFPRTYVLSNIFSRLLLRQATSTLGGTQLL